MSFLGIVEWFISNHNFSTSKINIREDLKEGMFIMSLELTLIVEIGCYTTIGISRVARGVL